jgi:hypothetical protein
MIQRIQTVFLALVAAAMAVLIASPLWSKIGASQAVRLSAQQLTHSNGQAIVASQSTIYITVAAAVAAGIALFSLLQFKNRKLQMLLGAINSLVIGITLGLVIFVIFKKGMPLFEPNFEGKYGIGFYAGAVAFFANWVANRFIRRDEMLVRSADRMR